MHFVIFCTAKYLCLCHFHDEKTFIHSYTHYSNYLYLSNAFKIPQFFIFNFVCFFCFQFSSFCFFIFWFFFFCIHLIQFVLYSLPETNEQQQKVEPKSSFEKILIELKKPKQNKYNKMLKCFTALNIKQKINMNYNYLSH